MKVINPKHITPELIYRMNGKFWDLYSYSSWNDYQRKETWKKKRQEICNKYKLDEYKIEDGRFHGSFEFEIIKMFPKEVLIELYNAMVLIK